MITGSYPVKRGDYLGGGQVSSKIKETLRRLGITSEIIRKIMIAVYEAEMNVIIHSYGGEISFVIDDDKIEITVKDTGPGIPRIDLAIQEGYSTAPDEAIEMGFGAGMGLPNIKKNSDYFTIHSEKMGTLLKILVFINSDKYFSNIDTCLNVESEKCKKCLRCITRCPTKAIRLYKEKIHILSHHCVNCNECIRVCPTKVFDLTNYEENKDEGKEKVLVAPSPWIASILFSCLWDNFEEVIINEKGLEIYPLAIWEDVLKEKTFEYIKNNGKIKHPVILPVCPAVLYWIQTEYPSLIDYIAPYLGPAETAVNSFEKQKRVFYIPSCPAEVCAIHGNKNSDVNVSFILPQQSIEMILNTKKRTTGEKQIDKIYDICVDKEIDRKIVKISGVEQVKTFLESIEKKRLMYNIEMVELYACHNGCFGSPYWVYEPTVARIIFDAFWKEQKIKYKENKFDGIFRVSTIKPRKGIRLDEDVRKAMMKLSEIEKISKSLPGYDCGVCGAPTCLNFAEDILMMGENISECPYLNIK